MNKKEIHQILAAQQKPTLTTLPFVLPRGVAGRRGGSRGRGATREATGSGLSARARKKRREKWKRGSRDSAMKRRRWRREGRILLKTVSETI